jgi:uncharacterized protein (TIGR02099 family)
MLVWGFRVLLVLYFAAALLILAGRHFLMAEVAGQRAFVEARLTAAIGLPVRIGGLAADWPGLHPRLAIEGMQILDDAGRPALAFDRVETEIGWSSLWHWRLRLHRLEIVAPALDIRRDAAGVVYVAGLAMRGEGDGAFADWLLEQGRIVVRDARVTWHDELRAAPPLELGALNFELRNAGRHHSFGLTARPPAAVAASLDLRGNLVGRDPDDLAQWHGELYADLARADLAAWAPWLDLPLEWTRGRGGLRLWLDFRNLAATGFTADLRLADVAVRLRPGLPELDLDHLEGRLAGRRTDNGYAGEIRRLTLSTRDGIDVAPTDARLVLDTRAGREAGEFHANGFDVGALAALAGHLPLPAQIHDRLRELTPRGLLADLDLEWRGAPEAIRGWRAKGRFAGLALAAWRELPGFAGISGSVEGDEAAGTVRIDSRDVRIELPEVFSEPTLALASLEAELGWRARDAALELLLSRIVFHNDDARGEASGSYRYTGDGLGEIDLSARLTQAAGNAVWRYMPLVVNQDARDWLRAGIVGGRSETASLRLKGPLEAFPFADGKRGIFQVKGTIQGATLRYAEGWPEMTGIDGDLLFDGVRMLIRGRRAEIMGVALSDITAEIPELDATEEVLHIKGRASGSTQRFLDFIEASPVGAQIDHFTQPMQAAGDGQLDLQLTMPLRHVADTKVEGRYRFAANELRVLPELPVFAAARGEFAFTGDSLRARGLRAEFLGAPALLDVASLAGGGVRVSAAGRLAVLGARKEYALRALEHLSGETPWRAVVTVKKPGADVLVESALDGISSSLPEPFNKLARVPLPFKLTGRIDPRGDEWTATLGAALALRLRHADGQWRGRAALGAAAAKPLAAPPARGMALAFEQPVIDIDAWRAVLAANGDNGAGSLPALSAIEVRAAEIRLAGRTFHDFQLDGTVRDDVWHVSLDSREARGRVSWDGAGPGRLAGRMERLWLPAAETAAASADEANELPALDLVVDDLRLRDMALGEARIAAENREGDWRAKLDIANEAARLNGEARWRPSRIASESALDFKLEIDDAEKLLGRLGMPDAVRRGAGHVEGSLAWSGTPFAFELKSLSGRVAAEIGKGQFKKLEPGVGRLLGVLSLQSLPRRITLDFRDVFSEGFAFDAIVGEARVARGLMSSEDLFIRGPAAKVALSGQVDLVDETQNLRVRVRPAVGETLAVGAMLANPVVGAVAWLAQKALDDPLDQAFAHEYAVTGSWSDPKVEKVARKLPETKGTPP